MSQNKINELYPTILPQRRFVTEYIRKATDINNVVTNTAAISPTKLAFLIHQVVKIFQRRNVSDAYKNTDLYTPFLVVKLK